MLYGVRFPTAGFVDTTTLAGSGTITVVKALLPF